MYTAFNGKSNSSKILLDNMDVDNKLYVKNSFKTSIEQLIKEIRNNEYELVISFGQAPLDKDVIKIEKTARGEELYDTDYDYSGLKDGLEKKYNVITSSDAGSYLCNNLYYYGLKYIKEHDLKTKMIFVHIPKMKDISNITDLAVNLSNTTNEK